MGQAGYVSLHGQHAGIMNSVQTLGTKYEGIRFRRVLLDTIPQIDELARAVIPSHPAMKPHARMLHHFRFILPLLPSITSEEENISFLHYYDSAIQIVRNSSREPTEAEFELGMQAAQEIINWSVFCLKMSWPMSSED
ncbi:hypothetical protein PC9H_003832 [Pleurotus ostreatus]|uniref:Uncharacterized protein n=1 Tax=Pleurotus ostreatus TaxID=5322 RepID=A0A8H6ZZT9_PLEOS|nr:uncharacterized protein PC9H_003832 [Pleurotus ostreatus]KAF7436998.1 hypothetical protein PC9H_003832 [Pleurotus ostreatus]